MKHAAATLIVGVVALLALGAVAPAAPRSHAPAISADQARQLLALSGVKPGATAVLPGLGRIRIDAIRITSEGRWLVIRVLPIALK